MPTRNCRGQSDGASLSGRCCAVSCSQQSLVVLYYLLPLDRPLNAGTVVRLLTGLLVSAGVMVWQVR